MVCCRLERDDWVVTVSTCRSFSVAITIAPSTEPGEPWTLVAVYGPVLDTLKEPVLDELRLARAHATGPVLFYGDFNQIYLASDKNNDRLNLRAMRRFRRLLNDLHLQELYLHGRLYTWSSHRQSPTLERTLTVRSRVLAGSTGSPPIICAASPQIVQITRLYCYNCARTSGPSHVSGLSPSGSRSMGSSKLLPSPRRMT